MLINVKYLSTVMYWNEIMSHKARTLVAKLRRQSRVRPYRERAEITPLLSAQNGHKTNGNSTSIDINSQLYPIVESFEEGKRLEKYKLQVNIMNK